LQSDSVDLAAKRAEIAALQEEIKILIAVIEKLDLDLVGGRREALVPYTTEAQAIEVERNIRLLRQFREKLKARMEEFEGRYKVRRDWY
jgi:hypothetical protein